MRRLMVVVLTVLVMCGCAAGGPGAADDFGVDDWEPRFAPVSERPQCSPEKLAELHDTTTRAGIVIDCHAVLPAGARVERQVIFQGARSVGASLRCGEGAEIGALSANGGSDTVIIRSGGGQPVHDVLISGCLVHGSIRIYGLGRNGEAPEVLATAGTSEHIATVRNAAPYRITLQDLEIVGRGRIPLYFAPGVHSSTVVRTVVRGATDGPAAYLDNEASRIRIVDSSITGDAREAIAIDGSDRNSIARSKVRGGINLYRCHAGPPRPTTTPSRNTIQECALSGCSLASPGVWIGSRSWRPSCPGDFARWNVVAANTLARGCSIEVGPGGSNYGNTAGRNQ